MKYTLTIEYETKHEMQQDLSASNYMSAWEDLDNYLRTLDKYENKPAIGIKEVRAKMIEILEDYKE